MKDNRKEYNKLVASKDGAYYFLESIFKHSDDFKGATGHVLRPVPKFDKGTEYDKVYSKSLLKLIEEAEA